MTTTKVSVKQLVEKLPTNSTVPVPQDFIDQVKDLLGIDLVEVKRGRGRPPKSKAAPQVELQKQEAEEPKQDAEESEEEMSENSFLLTQIGETEEKKDTAKPKYSYTSDSE